MTEAALRQAVVISVPHHPRQAEWSARRWPHGRGKGLQLRIASYPVDGRVEGAEVLVRWTPKMRQ